jgi:hypothetical protein
LDYRNTLYEVTIYNHERTVVITYGKILDV